MILFSLPSHTTHCLQPHDRSFFKPLKNYWSQTCQNWVHNNPGRKLDPLQIAALLNVAWCKVATCGTYPYNPEQIPDYALVLKEVAQTQENLNPVTNRIEGQNENGNFPDVNRRDDIATCVLEDRNVFDEILPVPRIDPEPSTSKCHRKQYGEVLTAPETIHKKRTKKEEKIKKIKTKRRKSNNV